MKLKKYKLRKLCLPNQIGKYGIPAPAIAFSNGKIRYLRISDISEEGTLVNTDKKSVESDDIEQYILEENDIVFARTGNSTGRAYLYDKRDGVMAYAGFLIKYQLDEHKVNPIYLRYFTLSTFYKQWVANLSVGSTRGNISAQTFADCPIVLPPRHQQDVLVETLSNIDAKIKLNRQINDNLEAMAKQLYDYWFVQFDFPNEEGKPYKSSGGAMVWNEKLKREIPQGWDFCFLENLLTIKNGRDHKHLADGIYPVYGSGGEMRKASEYLYDGESVLMPRKGSLNNIMYVNEAFWTVDTMFYSEMKQSNCAKYIYYTIKDIDFTRWDSGTGVPSMTSSTLYSIKLVKPQSEILKKFDEVISPLFEHMKQISEQNSVLTKQRDELIPLLMNGQASINYHLFVLFISKIIVYYKETNINFEYERNNTKRFRWNEIGFDR